MTDTKTEKALHVPRLNTRIVGSRIVQYAELESTNDTAAQIGGDGTVVVADRQTAGRGRHGRTWHSIPGKGLYFTIAFEGDQPGAAFLAPLAVRNACRPHCSLTVKWPNDLLHEGRKLCGILVEKKKDHTILGIGINVNHDAADLPNDLAYAATSLRIVTGAELDRTFLLRDILFEIDQFVVAIRSGELEKVRREWADACAMTGRRIRHERVEGIVQSIDEHGGLVVASDSGEHHVVFGDVIERDPA